MPRYKPSPDEEQLYGPVKPPGAGAKPDAAMHPKEGMETPPKDGEEREPETTDEESASMENSAIVPNKVLMGPDGQMPKEGEEIVLKVVKNYGDESEVMYAPKKEPGPEMGPMSSADGEIDAMDKPEMM